MMASSNKREGKMSLELLSKEEINREYALKFLYRYTNRPRVLQETVAEHSFFVSIFGLKILSQLKDKLTLEEQNQVLIMCALHDTAESRTSDVPHNVKARYPEMRAILEEVERDYYNECWPDYADIVLNENSLIFKIMKLADSYSVLQYAQYEIGLGNHSEDIEEIYFNAKQRVESWNDAVNEEIAKREKESK